MKERLTVHTNNVIVLFLDDDKIILVTGVLQILIRSVMFGLHRV